MKAIINTIGEIGLAFVPKAWQPFAKAALPFLVTLAAVGLAVLGAGHWDKVATQTAVIGLLGSFLTFAVPNLKR